MDIRGITEGYYNLLKKKIKISNKDIEEMANYRMNICNDCSENESGKCTQCGCLLEAKVRCIKNKCKCPLGKW